MMCFDNFRFSTAASELAKAKSEVCAVQTLINCANWNPNLLYVVTYQGIMVDDGSVDLEGFVSTDNSFKIYIIVLMQIQII